MRLLHVFPSFGLGGQQVRLATLAQALGPAFTHQVLSLDGDISAARLFAGRVDAAPLVLKKTGFLDAANLRLLAAAIRKSGAAVLYTYNFGSLEAAVANRFDLRLPHIHQEDGFGPDEASGRQKLKRVLFRRLLLRRSTTVVPSIALEQSALRVWKLPASGVRRIPNGVDIARFSAVAPPRIGGVTVGSVGALRREKNYHRLIRCFCAAQILSARLILVGDGPELASLQALSAASGGSVDFPGRMTAPEEAYARFDIFALSSDTEQMPLSLMEAMAAGLPVVATDVGDVVNMVSAVNRPFIVRTDDEAGFADCLARLGADADLRRTIGEANRRVAMERFGLDAMVDAYRALCFSVALSKS